MYVHYNKVGVDRLLDGYKNTQFTFEKALEIKMSLVSK